MNTSMATVMLLALSLQFRVVLLLNKEEKNQKFKIYETCPVNRKHFYLLSVAGNGNGCRLLI